MQRFVDVRASLPSLSKIIRRVGGQNDRTLNSGDAGGGNQEKLRGALEVLQNCKSLRDSVTEVHLDARLGIVTMQLTGDAFIVHDYP